MSLLFTGVAILMLSTRAVANTTLATTLETSPVDTTVSDRSPSATGSNGADTSAAAPSAVPSAATTATGTNATTRGGDSNDTATSALAGNTTSSPTEATPTASSEPSASDTPRVDVSTSAGDATAPVTSTRNQSDPSITASPHTAAPNPTAAATTRPASQRHRIQRTYAVWTSLPGTWNLSHAGLLHLDNVSVFSAYDKGPSVNIWPRARWAALAPLEFWRRERDEMLGWIVELGSYIRDIDDYLNNTGKPHRRRMSVSIGCDYDANNDSVENPFLFFSYNGRPYFTLRWENGSDTYWSPDVDNAFIMCRYLLSDGGSYWSEETRNRCRDDMSTAFAKMFASYTTNLCVSDGRKLLGYRSGAFTNVTTAPVQWWKIMAPYAGRNPEVKDKPLTIVTPHNSDGSVYDPAADSRVRQNCTLLEQLTNGFCVEETVYYWDAWGISLREVSMTACAVVLLVLAFLCVIVAATRLYDFLRRCTDRRTHRLEAADECKQQEKPSPKLALDDRECDTLLSEATLMSVASSAQFPSELSLSPPVGVRLPRYESLRSLPPYSETLVEECAAPRNESRRSPRRPTSPSRSFSAGGRRGSAVSDALAIAGTVVLAATAACPEDAATNDATRKEEEKNDDKVIDDDETADKQDDRLDMLNENEIKI